MQEEEHADPSHVPVFVGLTACNGLLHRGTVFRWQNNLFKGEVEGFRSGVTQSEEEEGCKASALLHATNFTQIIYVRRIVFQLCSGSYFM